MKLLDVILARHNTNTRYLPLVIAFSLSHYKNLVSHTFNIVETRVQRVKNLKPIKTVTDFGAPSVEKITSHRQNQLGQRILCG